jgi:putative phosphoesterase
MKIGVLSDAHGNVKWLSLCLEEMEKEKVDKIYFLGDAVGYFSNWESVCVLLRERVDVSLLGNHDAMYIGTKALDKDKDTIYRIVENKKKFSEKLVSHFNDLLPFRIERICEKDILFVHGSPSDPLSGYVYENDIPSKVNVNSYDVVFMGHTHIPYIKKNNDTLFVNVGSCGLPRDHGNLPSFAVIDFALNKCEIMRIKMDTHEVLEEGLHSAVTECLLRKPSSLEIGTITRCGKGSI